MTSEESLKSFDLEVPLILYRGPESDNGGLAFKARSNVLMMVDSPQNSALLKSGGYLRVQGLLRLGKDVRPENPYLL